MDNVATLDDRLTRNTIGLMASSSITSMVGVAFWFAAARLFDTHDVGRGVALITSMVLLSNISTLGLRNAPVRFIPSAGASAKRFIVVVYLLCVSAAIAASVAFLVGLKWWAGELAFVTDSPLSTFFFIFATAIWTLFVLQDSVLTGLRSAMWVPVENAFYSVGKLGGLFLFSGVGAWAFGLAWAIPAVVTLIPATWLIRRRLHADPMQQGQPQPTYRRVALVRFAVGEQSSEVLRTAGAELVVLIVLARRGLGESGSFFLAVTVAATLALLSANIASAFMAEAAARPHDERALLHRSARLAALLVVPASLVTCIAAPTIMGVFGATYRNEAGTLLSVLALGSMPQALIALGVGVARLHRRMVVVAMLFGASAVGPLVGALLLSADRGLIVVGISTVIGQSFVAGVLLMTLLRPLTDGLAAHDLVARAARGRNRLRQSHRVREVAALLDELDTRRGVADQLIPRRVVVSDNDVVIVAVDRPDRPMIVKLALSDSAAEGLQRHADAIEALHRLPRRPVLDLVPHLVERGVCRDHVYMIESACPGRPPLVADHETGRITADAMRAVHELTVAVRRVDDSLIETIVDKPIELLLTIPRLAVHRHALDDLRLRLHSELRGRLVHVARTHGDCWTGNFLIVPDGAGQRVSGIIDWEDSVERGLADVDLAHHWLAMQDDEIGGALRSALDSGRGAAVFDDHGLVRFDPDLPASVVLTLAWLAYVANGLRRATKFGLSSWWIDRNLVEVLRFITSLPELSESERTDATAGELTAG